MTVTLADVAREGGVSTAAASLALNGKPGVSESTRGRVLDTARRLGYRPNPAGRALRGARVGSVGIHMPASAVYFGYYYTEVTKGVADRLHEHGISLLTMPNSSHTSAKDAFPSVDGYILIEPHSDDDRVGEILAQSLPVVSGDRPASHFSAPWGLVETPNATVVRTVFDRFLTAGARHPGMIQIERVSEWTHDLEQAYVDWCAEHGLAPRITHVSIHQSNEDLVETLRGFFDTEDGCDAVFAAGDAIAVRIAGILRSLGKSIGRDVLLVSGVDSPLMEFHTPSITAVDLQPRLFGAMCADLLLDLLGETRPPEPARRTVATPLVERASG